MAIFVPIENKETKQEVLRVQRDLREGTLHKTGQKRDKTARIRAAIARYRTARTGEKKELTNSRIYRNF